MKDTVVGPRPLQTPEDAKILQLTVELSHQIGIHTNPTSISWSDRIGTVKAPYGQALFTVFGEIVLSKNLMGKLGPEEWKPIIVSSLIFHRKFRTKSELGFAARMLLPMVPVLVLMLTVFPSLGEQPPAFLVAGFIGGVLSMYLALSALAWSSSWKHMKRMALKADSQSLEYVGREGFLEVLRKLESLGLEEKGFRARLQPRPTIRERIQSLESSE